jgi:hypothetical protein
MQVKVFGPMAGPGPHGDIVSWAPNAIVDVDDGDEDAVAFYRGFVKAGIAEVLEEPKSTKATSAVTSAATGGNDELPPPPKAGPGSSRDAWVEYAERLDIEVTDDMTRDEIIAAVES